MNVKIADMNGVRGMVKMIAGYDETWNESDDFRIVTCRLTCGFVIGC